MSPKRSRTKPSKIQKPSSPVQDLAPRMPQSSASESSLDLEGAIPAELPRDLKPMLASPAPVAFSQDGWIFEIKWDGYRAIAELDGSSVRIHSRNANRLDPRYPGLVGPLAQLGRSAVLDGEIVVLDREGVAQFEWLQGYPRYGGQLVYYVFDLLHVDGHNVMELPLARRKELLRQILPHASPHIRFCDHIDMDGETFFDAIRQRGIEGMVAKDATSRYVPGRRSKRWLKIKVHGRQEAVIAGYKEGEGSRQQLGSLVLGVLDGDALVHIGEVGTGMSETTVQSLLDRLKSSVQNECPFAKKPKIAGRVHWVKPSLRCEVKFHSWTADGKLRQPVWIGLRENPSQTHEPQQAGPRTRRKSFRRTSELVEIGGRQLTLTNLEKAYWPKYSYAKRDLVAYYRQIAPTILPYLKDRPVSLNRFPDGVDGKSFFQKDMRKAPDWVPTVSIRHDSRERAIRYALCQDEATLVYLANLGSIEIHPWHSRAEMLDRPDYLVIDLDPRETPFSKVIDVALEVRAILDKGGAACWCKTSGMSGLHVYVPLGQVYDYQQAAQFADLVARLVHQRLPHLTSLDRDPARRRSLVYLDSLQNRRGQSVVSVYSLRANSEAKVSTPLRWSEVKEGLDPETFTMHSVLKRIDKVGDLWAGVLGTGIDMMECLKRLPRLIKVRS